MLYLAVEKDIHPFPSVLRRANLTKTQNKLGPGGGGGGGGGGVGMFI